MQEDQLLDFETPEQNGKLFYNFQIIEFALIALYGLLYALSKVFLYSNIQDVGIVFCFALIIFQGIRIYLEYKHQLITGFGILMKLFLLTNACVIFFGVLFKIADWEFQTEMFITALMSLGYPFIIYALALKGVRIPIKGIFVFNSIALSLLSFGIMFRIESWPYGHEMVIAGFIVLLISFFLFSFLLKMNPTKKENYHATNYLGRSFLILLFSFAYLF